MAKTPSARMCEVESRISDDNGKNYWSEDVIKSAIASHDCIEQWCYILHDKCTQPDGTPKAPHYHVYLKFRSEGDGSGARRFSDIAKWFGLDVQYVGYIKGHWADAVSYATHANAPEKYQYDFSEVKSNFDVQAVTEKRMEQRANKKRLQEIIDGIDKSVIMRYNMYDHITCYEYSIYKNKIENAFKFRGGRVSQEARHMDVIYIHGASGTGKTTYAKMIADKQGLVSFMSPSGRDIMDTYASQPCIILDDLRPDDLRFNTLIKMIDNHNNTGVESRYNVKYLECSLLIITSIMSIPDFYKRLQFSAGEEYKQIVRRCGTLLNVYRTTIKIYTYNEMIDKYELVQEIPNPVNDLYKPTQARVDAAKRKSLSLLGLDIAQPVQNNSQSETDLGDFIELFDESGQTS